MLSGPAAAALSRIAHFRHFPAGRILQPGHLDASWFAIIISGVVKIVKALPDGRQQIVGLQFPADFLGRPYAASNTFSTEATTSLLLCCFPRSGFESLMQEHPCLEEALLRNTLDQLDAAREWMFTLGRKTAQEKMASLLYLIAVRLAPLSKTGSAGTGQLEINLPLSRTEMADCLGLTHETVSREICELRRRGVIATRGRRTLIVSQLEALERLATAAGTEIPAEVLPQLSLDQPLPQAS